jgi:hypothetical protein
MRNRSDLDSERTSEIECSMNSRPWIPWFWIHFDHREMIISPEIWQVKINPNLRREDSFKLYQRQTISSCFTNHSFRVRGADISHPRTISDRFGSNQNIARVCALKSWIEYANKWSLIKIDSSGHYLPGYTKVGCHRSCTSRSSGYLRQLTPAPTRQHD